MNILKCFYECLPKAMRESVSSFMMIFRFKGGERLVQLVLLALSATCTFFTLGWVLWLCRYGIDFRDEGFYLVWMADPFKYDVSVTQFGFIYHPLYELLQGNIAAIRQANILITYCLAWALCNSFIKTVFEKQVIDRAPRLIISAAIAISALVFQYIWLATPSYNWLALNALFIAACGLLFADKKYTSRSFLGWFLIGVGGWLAFMAKPSTAAALGLCLGLYLVFSGKFSLRLLAISIATSIGLLLISALVIDGSVILFIGRISEGAELAKLMGAGHNLGHFLRMDSFQLDGRTRFLLIAGVVCFSSTAFFSQAKSKTYVFVGAMLSVLFVSIGFAIILGLSHRIFDISYHRGFLLFSVPFAAVFVGLVLNRHKAIRHITRAQWSLAFIFLIFPYIYVFGTVNNYWWQSTHAGIFWVLSGLVFLNSNVINQKFTALLLPLGISVQLVTIVLVQSGVEAPYGQSQSLRENDYKIEIGKPRSTLLLSKGTGQYLSEAIDLANYVGFKKGTPMIDLSGQSPTIIYAIGASNTSQAWIVGGYPGSYDLAVAMLKRVTCEELTSAWLLTEPEGLAKISPDILLSFGANIATDYEIVGSLKATDNIGNFKQFLKPIRSNDTAMAACAAERSIK